MAPSAARQSPIQVLSGDSPDSLWVAEQVSGGSPDTTQIRTAQRGCQDHKNPDLQYLDSKGPMNEPNLRSIPLPCVLQ